MKRLKNFICFVLSITVLAGSCIVFSVAAYGSSVKSWNISADDYKKLGEITSTTTVGELTFNATSDKYMSVVSNSVTLGRTYTHALNLRGAGDTSSRSLSTTLSGGSKYIIGVVSKSTGSDTRTLKITDGEGNELGTIASTSTAAAGMITTDYDGTIYVCSAGSGIYIYELQIITYDDTPSGAPEPSSYSVEVTTFDELADEAAKMANKSGGGTVYVNAKRIDCTARLNLSSISGNPVAIVGVVQEDGTYPVLDFTSFRESTIGSTGGTLVASGDAHVGVRITGSNYTVKNLIIEKAGDNGIQIKNPNDLDNTANYNTVENCIVRYNNDAGLQITKRASNNVIKYVYSYRNCDVYTRGGNADGFAPKLGGGTGNKFYGCYAWDNSDDGWDSFDYDNGPYTYDLTYEECGVWNNGNSDVFTGKYDYENGKELDTNLFLVDLITKQDSSFSENYKNRNYALPSMAFINTDKGTLSVSAWAGASFGGNPNGFKMGSANSLGLSIRDFKRCFAYNHASRGFDNNNSTQIAFLSNTVSFDNKTNNYSMPKYILKRWSNVIGFSGSNSLPSGYSSTSPSNASDIRAAVLDNIEEIEGLCYENKIPGSFLFDIYVDTTVTFNLNEGEGENIKIKVDESGTVSFPANPKREGYRFKGWFTDGGEEFTADMPVYESIIVYAKWLANEDDPSLIIIPADRVNFREIVKLRNEETEATAYIGIEKS